MKYTLYYTSDDNYNGLSLGLVDYPYSIDISLEDIIEYLYEKEFNKEFPIDYYLYKEAEDLVRKLQVEWFKGQLSYSDFYTTRNLEFLTWLKKKYYQDVLDYIYSYEFCKTEDDEEEDLF